MTAVCPARTTVSTSRFSTGELSAAHEPANADGDQVNETNARGPRGKREPADEHEQVSARAG